MSNATTSLTRLAQLPERWRHGAAQQAAAAQFPLRIPSTFANRIQWDDGDDPLLRQVLPTPEEMLPGGSEDPVGEQDRRVAGDLIHKYAGRALLVVTSSCDIHCRYCFRRHFPYEPAPGRETRWEAAVTYLTAHPEVSELILSGGDPLTLSNRRLARLLEQLVKVPHLKRLRVHSRTPTVKPGRVDNGLLAWFAKIPWPSTLVLHCNHPAELGPEAQSALKRLRALPITLLNQAVLLRGVNDDPKVLAELSESLFATGVLPYYLHQMDPVAGAGHFAVATDRARQLMDQLRERLPGYLVPRLVADPPGRPAKQVLA
ncbi:MAG: EF-P beta-lysylation protein EpmB [Pseudomonadota bacterium]